MSLSLMPPTRLEQHADRHLVVLELFQFLGEGFDRPLDVGLDDQVEGLDLLLGHPAVEVFQGDGLAFRLGGVAGAVPPRLGDLAGAGDIVDDGEGLAGRGNDVETGDRREWTARPRRSPGPGH